MPEWCNDWMKSNKKSLLVVKCYLKIKKRRILNTYFIPLNLWIKVVVVVVSCNFTQHVFVDYRALKDWVRLTLKNHFAISRVECTPDGTSFSRHFGNQPSANYSKVIQWVLSMGSCFRFLQLTVNFSRLLFTDVSWRKKKSIVSKKF